MMSNVRQIVKRETMAYLLIFDLKGRESANRRRVNRYLNREARMIQQSVWEFKNLQSLMNAAELVSNAGGRALAFVKSDQILLCRRDITTCLSNLLAGHVKRETSLAV